MHFTTQIPIAKSNSPITYNSKILSMGSCFAVNMAEKLDYFKFQNTANPFGILFHPLALEDAIRFALNEKQFGESDIFFHDERWHCFDAHSDLSDANKAQLLENLNTNSMLIKSAVANASHLILTLGTAWVYRNTQSLEMVANCHKVPQKQFKKELLSSQNIRQSLLSIMELLRLENPEIQVIFTISPVRHLKDGFSENQWSKSNLISAVQEIVHQFQNSGNVHYFPSFEIMMDELRDYRFYAEDMIHPNKTAIDYIWKRFTETWISESSIPVMEQIDVIQKSLRHRPFNPNSESHIIFLSKLSDKISMLQNQFSHIRF